MNGIFYKSFKIMSGGKRIDFFAEELVSGKSYLYSYNGEQLDKEPIYIFKKETEFEYNFVKEEINTKSEYGIASKALPQVDNSSQDREPISFIDEEPFLQYFQSYLSDCRDVVMKFKNKWYSYSSVKSMFLDYNKCK